MLLHKIYQSTKEIHFPKFFFLKIFKSGYAADPVFKKNFKSESASDPKKYPDIPLRIRSVPSSDTHATLTKVLRTSGLLKDIRTKSVIIPKIYD